MNDRAPKPVRRYPAEKARQGRIILDTRWKRIVFLASLVGTVIIVIAFATILAFERP